MSPSLEAGTKSQSAGGVKSETFIDAERAVLQIGSMCTDKIKSVLPSMLSLE